MQLHYERAGGANNRESAKRYSNTRRVLKENLKLKDYWPEGITHPSQYRRFYAANDLSYCGFARSEAEIDKKR